MVALLQDGSALLILIQRYTGEQFAFSIAGPSLGVATGA